MKTALLVSTYNWVEALELIFKSILVQTKLPDEILIADDGSDDKTKSLIDAYRKKLPIPIKHVWQEDDGFRKSKILNKTIASSNSEYIIQVDGDCILHDRFVEDHINNASERTYLYGTRVNILPQYVKEVLEKQIISFNYFSKEIKNKSRTFHIPLLSKLYKKQNSYSTKFRGCNVSFWRKDFIAINGYNEDFEGWGKEDSDLAIRLNNNGIQSRRLRYVGVVFHIYHKIRSKDNLDQNKDIQSQTMKNKITRIEKGVDRYL